jgi:transcription initiation factor TFIIIB Brf1 subunit/transcription initiation factor TFIIB
LVVAESAVDTGPEWRSFDKEKRVRTVPLKLVVKTDMAVKAEHGARWRRLARFHRETLHGRERRLVKIGAELKRIRECVGLPQSVAEEAEALVKRYFEVVAGFPPEVVAVAVLWTAAKAAGAPRPLEDFLKCSKASERRVRRVAWRLKEEARLGRRPIEDYVKTLAARVNLPAPIVKAAVELLEKNRRILFGKNPWVSAAAALWLASLKKLGLLKALAEAAGTTTVSIRKAAGRMRVWKIRQYLPALLLHIQRRVGGERGVVVAVRTRDICGVDRRCGRAVYSLMMRLVEKGLAKRHKKGTYLIERRAMEEVLTALREWI